MSGGGPRKLGYQPALDGLRAVAVAAVVLKHYAAFPDGGFLGVDLFFVLSGFLITVLLLEERRVHGSISLRRFYARRALRLVPALWVLLVAYVAVALAKGDAPRTVLLTFVYGLTYTMNVVIAFGANTAIALSHLWSLGVEEQFYLLWPALLVLWLRGGARWRWLVLALLGSAVTIAAVRYALRPPTIGTREDAGSVTRFDSILIGCAFGLAFSSRSQRRLLALTRRRLPVLVAVGLGIWLMVAGAGNDFFYRGKSFLFALAAGVVVVAVLRRGEDDRPLALAVLGSAPFVFVGRISYALYLWHSPLLVWTKNADLAAHVGQVGARGLALAASVAAATASHYVVERPFLRLKWRLARTSSHDVSIEAAVHGGDEPPRRSGMPAAEPAR